MKVSQIINQRRPLWQELESLCEVLTDKNGAMRDYRQSRSAVSRRCIVERVRRSRTCRSLSTSAKTVDYLHRLVARCHNQLYRSKRYQWDTWFEKVFHRNAGSDLQRFRGPHRDGSVLGAVLYQRFLGLRANGVAKFREPSHGMLTRFLQWRPTSKTLTEGRGAKTTSWRTSTSSTMVRSGCTASS